MSKNQSYHVITLDVSEDSTDLIQGLLYQKNCRGIEEFYAENKTLKMKAYFDDQGSLQNLIALVQSLHPDIYSSTGVTINLSQIQQQIHSFEPIELIKNIWIVPPSDMPYNSAEPEGEKIILRPGMAFGTGRHETTQLVAQCLKEQSYQENSILDIGTGSGILALLARQIGHLNIDTVEIDKDAIRNTKENFSLNQADDIPVYQNLRELNKSYDILLANILTPTILFLKDDILQRKKETGKLILSGITKDEGSLIENAFSDLSLLDKKVNGEWLAFVYQ